MMGLLRPNSDLVGYEGGEVFGHAWMHWWRGDVFPQWPQGTTLALGMNNAPPIDPLAVIFSSCMGGGAWGYNMWIWFSLFLAAIGGGVLSKRMGGSFFWGAILLAWSPPFLGSLSSGLSEDGGLGLIALAIAYAHGENTSWWKSGLFLGLSFWSGLVLGWLGGMLCFLLMCMYGREQFSFWCKVFGLAFVLCLPVLWPHLARIGGDGHRTGEFVYGMEPLWQVNPWKQLDLASLVSWGRVSLGDSLVRVHPGYVGMGVCVLALYRKQWIWLACMVLFLGLALSDTIRFAGSPTEMGNPIAWLWHQLPFAQQFNHHGRAMLIVSVVLVAATAHSFRWWSVLLLFEILVLSPISVILPTTRAVHSSALVALREIPVAGRVVHVPAFGPGISFQRPLWIQHIHKKPLYVHPNQPNLLAKSSFYQGLMEVEKPLSWSDDIGGVIIDKALFPEKIDMIQNSLGVPYAEDEAFVVWVQKVESTEN